MFGLVFTALGFMLVFRLSRAAIRFWDCRTAWGTIAMRGRALMDDVIVSLGPHAPKVRVARFRNPTTTVSCTVWSTGPTLSNPGYTRGPKH